jgi:hypothetical protein
LHDLGLYDIWPRTHKTGRKSAQDEIFRKFSSHPEVERLRQIRAMVDQLDEPKYVIRHGRHYYSILPFRAKTSRNATKSCLFQAPTSLRGLIRPPHGTGLIYADYSQQEYYIAAVLSGDLEMRQLYEAGRDPYVAFGGLVGIMPLSATKSSHPYEREIAKTVCLAAMYGQSIPGMARKLGISSNRAADLLRIHQRRSPRVWQYIGDLVRISYARRRIKSHFGWRMTVHSETRKTTLRNYKIQSTGADILRHAHLLLFEAGFRVCAPVHDAFLIEVPEAELEDAAEEIRHIMARAGRYVLGEGTILRADARLLRHPERLLEAKGSEMWHRMLATLARISGISTGGLGSNAPSPGFRESFPG